MIYSMTAFSRAQRDHTRQHLVWELKSVNHRFLEVQVRVPDALRALEPRVRELVRSHLKRGKVDCTLRMERIQSEAAIDINRPLLLQLVAALQQVRRDAPEIGGTSPMDLLRWPGVLGDPALTDEGIEEAALDTFEEALSALIENRQREGAALGEAVFARLDDINHLITQVKSLTRDIPRAMQERLRQRLAELATELDTGRLEQEIALLAQRADVAEELDRLTIHVEEARHNLQSQGPHGRRLDFLTQELNREANTLAAKATTAETSQRAVDLKVAIEQIREQVQNIE